MDSRRLPDYFTEARRAPDLAVVEGFHAVKHALRFGADFAVLVTRDPAAAAALAARLAPDVAAALTTATGVDEATFDRLFPVPPPTGIAGVAARPLTEAAAVLDAPGPAPVIYLDRPRHLGNVGAVVRVAAAAGAAGVVTSGDADPWDPAAIRGAAGLHFALPVARGRLEDVSRPVVAIDPGGAPLAPGIVPDRAVLAFGSERGGLDPEVRSRASAVVRLPMRPGVSSLNLATAVAAVLYSGVVGGPPGSLPG